MCIISDRIRFVHPHFSHHILYAGNDLELLNFLEERMEDCQVVRAPTGHVATIFIKSEIKYSLLVVDENLPDMMGLKLAGFTRSLAHRESTPIIILSENKGRRAGVRFNKPNEFELLLTVIAGLLET